MKRILFAAVALTVSLGLLSSAEAGRGGGKGRGNFGGKFGGGNFVKHNHGQNFRHNGNFKGGHQFNKFHGNQFHGAKFHHKPFHKKIVIGHPKFHHGHHKFHNYHLHHGKKFGHGYCYVGNHHTHWASTIWSPDCGCYTYYCPYTLAWYYWCQPDGCFYPVSYCPYGTFAF